MRRINRNLYPKSGYVFKDTDGTRHIGGNWAHVIGMARRYRQKLGRPVDTVEQEVNEQACRNNPELCIEESAANQAQLKKVSLKGRILLWLGARQKRKERGPLVFVPDALHAARVDVCSRCVKNTAMPDGCGSCRAALREMTSSLIGSRAVDDRVQGCLVLGEYLPVSTWIEDTAIPNPDLPWECWRKRTL
jgi:hypothetical protein